MAASYPGSVKSFSAKTDDVDDVMAADVNSAYDEINAVETELGADVAGTATNLVTRLAKSLSGAGYLQFAQATTLTIASGVVTATQNAHILDTQGSGATDDLDTINGYADGRVLFLRIADGARNVVLKHGTGNIYCAGAGNITLDTQGDLAILIYDDAIDKWIALGASGSGLLGGSNTWTGTNYFNYGLRKKYTATVQNVTLDPSYYVVDVDATTAAVTITLPTAVSIAGQEYNIRKADSSANAVILDGNASETINGVATYGITSQYQSTTIMSNGANWIIL